MYNLAENFQRLSIQVDDFFTQIADLHDEMMCQQALERKLHVLVLGCAVLLCFVVCMALSLLASFFLLSASLISIHVYMHVIKCCTTSSGGIHVMYSTCNVHVMYMYTCILFIF